MSHLSVAYTELVQAVKKYEYLFVEPELRSRLAVIFRSVAPLSKGNLAPPVTPTNRIPLPPPEASHSPTPPAFSPPSTRAASPSTVFSATSVASPFASPSLQTTTSTRTLHHARPQSGPPAVPPTPNLAGPIPATRVSLPPVVMDFSGVTQSSGFVSAPPRAGSSTSVQSRSPSITSVTSQRKPKTRTKAKKKLSVVAVDYLDNDLEWYVKQKEKEKGKDADKETERVVKMERDQGTEKVTDNDTQTQKGVEKVKETQTETAVIMPQDQEVVIARDKHDVAGKEAAKEVNETGEKAEEDKGMKECGVVKKADREMEVEAALDAEKDVEMVQYVDAEGAQTAEETADERHVAGGEEGETNVEVQLQGDSEAMIGVPEHNADMVAEEQLENERKGDKREEAEKVYTYEPQEETAMEGVEAADEGAPTTRREQLERMDTHVGQLGQEQESTETGQPMDVDGKPQQDPQKTSRPMEVQENPLMKQGDGRRGLGYTTRGHKKGSPGLRIYPAQTASTPGFSHQAASTSDTMSPSVITEQATSPEKVTTTPLKHKRKRRGPPGIPDSEVKAQPLSSPIADRESSPETPPVSAFQASPRKASTPKKRMVSGSSSERHDPPATIVSRRNTSDSQPELPRPTATIPVPDPLRSSPTVQAHAKEGVGKMRQIRIPSIIRSRGSGHEETKMHATDHPREPRSPSRDAVPHDCIQPDQPAHSLKRHFFSPLSDALEEGEIDPLESTDVTEVGQVTPVTSGGTLPDLPDNQPESTQCANIVEPSPPPPPPRRNTLFDERMVVLSVSRGTARSQSTTLTYELSADQAATLMRWRERYTNYEYVRPQHDRIGALLSVMTSSTTEQRCLSLACHPYAECLAMVDSSDSETLNHSEMPMSF
ncbi:hypothetical protein BC835DRAFT_830542 [Cytidiella melzeri]|nr:hypothetical protein BC835DRAFT_830542 [Cytidiella melzeri]